MYCNYIWQLRPFMFSNNAQYLCVPLTLAFIKSIAANEIELISFRNPFSSKFDQKLTSDMPPDEDLSGTLFSAQRTKTKRRQHRSI